MDASHIGCSWSNPGGFRIVAYRLTDGWIPVFGKCPFPAGTKIDFRKKDGKIYLNAPAIPYGYEWKKDIVAVRLIKAMQDNPAPWIREQIQKAKEIVAARPEWMKKVNHIGGAIVETSQQRLTREASTRYFEKLHKKEERMLPLGDMGIENRIFAALCESFKKG